MLQTIANYGQSEPHRKLRYDISKKKAKSRLNVLMSRLSTGFECLSLNCSKQLNEKQTRSKTIEVERKIDAPYQRIMINGAKIEELVLNQNLPKKHNKSENKEKVLTISSFFKFVESPQSGSSQRNLPNIKKFVLRQFISESKSNVDEQKLVQSRLKLNKLMSIIKEVDKPETNKQNRSQRSVAQTKTNSFKHARDMSLYERKQQVRKLVYKTKQTHLLQKQTQGLTKSRGKEESQKYRIILKLRKGKNQIINCNEEKERKGNENKRSSFVCIDPWEAD